MHSLPSGFSNVDEEMAKRRQMLHACRLYEVLAFGPRPSLTAGIVPTLRPGVTSADPRVTNPVVVDTLLQFPLKYGYSGQDCWQVTLLLKFDLLPKIPCCFNLLMLNFYAGYASS